ncbi:MAG: CCA tRNA nucleotidyltransferase [Treponemataceae bacterium]|nr:CCA tRNA nucleotidyltransferase [Treponemataceae bacterium]
MKCVQIPSNLKKMNQFFENAGFKAYLVGGAVRDMLLGQKVSDFDLATNATPEQVMSIFKKVIPTGIEHGTVTVLFMGTPIEVTTFRIEQGYSDSRHPDKISFTDDITEDLSRRDFTINAMAASLLDGKIIDPFDGQKDLKNKIIRTVGSATERFSEDGLRPIRAIRFASKLNFKIEEETLKAIPLAIEKTKTISIERFRDEFCKMLVSEKPSISLKLMEETGILEFFLPELASCRNITQADFRGIHNFDILDHLFYACDGAPKEKLLVRIAALFHDIGKPATRKEETKIDTDGTEKPIITFFGHEKKSEQICKKIMTRLKFSNAEIDYVCHLIKEHMFFYESSWTDGAIRRFITRNSLQKYTPLEIIEDLFDLRIADVTGMTNTPPVLKNGRWSENLIEFKDRIDNCLNENTALSLKDLAINGNDLMQIGLKGKQIGWTLNELLQDVLESPSDNTKEKLIEIAKNINS